VDWIRAAVGDRRAAPEILSIGTWTLNATVASELVRGRAILVGDAAHQLPPTGGFGVNTGIQDAHNVAWKLALVRSGAAGRGLLDTYGVERRAVAKTNVQRSLENSMMVARINAAARGDADAALTPDEAVAASRRYGNFLGMELGFRYDSAAVVPDGTAPEKVADEVIDYAPSARPGSRAPHVRLDRVGGPEPGPSSTLDLFGLGFTVLAGRAGREWRAAAVDTAGRFGVPLEAYAIGADGGFVDRDGDFARVYGVEDDGAVLVRPDGHVAFRASSSRDVAPREALARVLGAVLDRPV
jgi:hypothetical protein